MGGGGGGGEELRKGNIDGANLNTVHFIHIANTTMKPLCTVNLC
jgi:hypothetical protein